MAAKIVEQWYRLMLWTVPKLGKFPRDQRFLLADRINKTMMDTLENLIDASYSKKEKAVPILIETNRQLEKLRYYSRLSKDLKYINVKGYHYFANEINRIGKMVGGWIKHNTGGD